MDSSSSSVPFLSIENSGRKRSRFPNKNSSIDKERSMKPSNCEITAFPTLSVACEVDKKENNDERKVENIRLMIETDTALNNSVHTNNGNNKFPPNMNPSEFPNISDQLNIEISPCVIKEDRDTDDHRDTSFLTQETAPESDSDSEREEMGSCICVTSSEDAGSLVGVTHIYEEESCSHYTSASSSAYSKQSIGVHFADEIGLPIRRICHYECDRKQREYSELVILCICPEKKTFEFLHVGYHMNEEIPTTVKDLLNGLPGLCTNETFVNARFVALYRNNEKSTGFQNLCAPSAQPSGLAKNDSTSSSDSGEDDRSLPLRDCDFRANELVVAAIHGSTELAVLTSIGPLLSNNKILKTLKRARRSRRGLKFISRNRYGSDEDKDGIYHREKSRDLALRRRKTNKEIKGSYEKHPNAVPQMNADGGDLLDEYCHDYDPLEYHTKLLIGILAIGSGTAVFSALGI